MVLRAETILVRQLQLFEGILRRISSWISSVDVGRHLSGLGGLFSAESVIGWDSENLVGKRKTLGERGRLVRRGWWRIYPHQHRLSATAVDRRIKQIETGLEIIKLKLIRDLTNAFLFRIFVVWKRMKPMNNEWKNRRNMKWIENSIILQRT